MSNNIEQLLIKVISIVKACAHKMFYHKDTGRSIQEVNFYVLLCVLSDGFLSM